MSAAEHGRPGGSRPALERAAELGPDGVVEELLRAGLRDRDYENGLTGERLRAHAAAAGDGKRVVCDCAGVEPGVDIARHLLANEPVAVVVGALAAAFATGTPALEFYVSADDGAGAEAIEAAGREVTAAGPALASEAAEAATAGVAGAARPARAAAGLADPAAVRLEVVRAPFRRNLKGYEDVPTLVLTAETLMNVSRVLVGGVEESRRVGTTGSTGAKLFEVTGCVKRPGIYELALGVTVRALVEEVCGGVTAGETLRAVLVGGAKGILLTPEQLDLPLDFDSVRDAGGIIGLGGVAVLGEDDCVVDQVKRGLRSTCYEECGMCSLGREGSYQLREIVTDMTRGKSRANDLEMLRETGEAMRAACACASGRNAANPVLTGLERFPEEFEAHTKRKRCRALVCLAYVTFHILPELCDGCGACVDECPEEAIEGSRGKIHVIDQDSCEKCGKCYEVCRGLRQAVVKAGPVKPRTPTRPIPVGSWKG